MQNTVMQLLGFFAYSSIGFRAQHVRVSQGRTRGPSHVSHTHTGTTQWIPFHSQENLVSESRGPSKPILKDGLDGKVWI